MHIGVPPGQRLPRVSATMSMSRAEAMDLQNALELAVAKGSSAWNMNISYADIEASVTLTLELDAPQNTLSPL